VIQLRKQVSSGARITREQEVRVALFVHLLPYAVKM